MLDLIELNKGKFKAEINPKNGQLISLWVNNRTNFFHNGGIDSYVGKGWPNSEIVCFPVFGPVNDSKVVVNDITYYLEQHGISRYNKNNPFDVSSKEKDEIVLVQWYDGRKIPNPKYTPENRRPENLNWMQYTLTKKFTLTNNGLVCTLTLTNDAKKDMPYIIAWHPAFKVFGEVEDGEFVDKDENLIATLSDVINSSTNPDKGALKVPNANIVKYKNKKTGAGVKVQSTGFRDNIILWSPSADAGMFCIEPTTMFPIKENQNYFADGKDYELLAPGKKKLYRILIEPIEPIKK